MLIAESQVNLEDLQEVLCNQKFFNFLGNFYTSVSDF